MSFFARALSTPEQLLSHKMSTLGLRLVGGLSLSCSQNCQSVTRTPLVSHPPRAEPGMGLVFLCYFFLLLLFSMVSATANSLIFVI
jgi:hypothetical protein